MMKLVLSLLLASFFFMIHPDTYGNPVGDTGVIQGSLHVNEKTITLRHVYAHLHDNAEGLLDKTERLRVLFTDREVPPEALNGISSLPIIELVKEGKAQGLLFEMAPDDPNKVIMTLLVQPSGQGRFLLRQSINLDEEDMLKEWSLDEQHLAGFIEGRKEREKGPIDFPAISYSIHFDAPLLSEPKITADLKGRAAIDSPEARLLSEKADALACGDLATARKISSERANSQGEGFMAGAKAEAIAAWKKSLHKIQRVVERGDRAVVILPGNKWYALVRESGEWKVDN